jgi:hypothetical protein
MGTISASAVLRFLVALSIGVALLQAAAYNSGFDVSDRGLSLWGWVFPITLAWWVALDSRGRPNIYRPFEFGWLVLYALPIYLPYYLFRTRGAAGLAALLGFVVLYILGFLLQLGLSLAS